MSKLVVLQCERKTLLLRWEDNKVTRLVVLQPKLQKTITLRDVINCQQIGELVKAS